MSKSPRPLWKTILYSILLFLAIVLIWFFSTRNSLVTMEQSIHSSWTQVENQLRRRYYLAEHISTLVKNLPKSNPEIHRQLSIARTDLKRAPSLMEKIICVFTLQ